MKILCALLLLASFGPGQIDVRYRVLRIERSDTSSDPWNRVGCAVSIANSVDVDTLKKVVCAVIQRENLNKYRSILISVYYGIAQLQDSPVDPVIPRDARHLIGVYNWNPSISPVGKLLVALDQKGHAIEDGRLTIEFSHKNDCR